MGWREGVFIRFASTSCSRMRRAAVFTLRIAALYETPRHVASGRRGQRAREAFSTFHPKLDYGAGDWEGTFVPQTSLAEKESRYSGGDGW
jgi:hypothetical protein